MKVLNKINNILDESDKLNESGIRNMRKWSKHFKTATIIFHQDLDGVVSGLGLKNYVENNGIKVTEAIPINYGDMEWSIKTPKPNNLIVAVDFAHAKGIFHIWTDHHSSEHIGTTKDMSTTFSHTPSNLSHIQLNISPRDIFPNNDLEIVATVDSADYLKHGIKPDQVMRAAFGVNKSISIKDNHWALGLVVNKLLLAYKNKPNFLATLVMDAKPSLISMYNVIVSLAKKEGYKPPEDIETDTVTYVEQQRKGIKQIKNVSEIKSIKSGQGMFLEGKVKTITQYGGGYMGKGRQYDRYVVFKNNPDADFLVIGWAMGLIQASKNPFKQVDIKVHLGDLVLGKVMQKYKSSWSNQMISLEKIKYKFESKIGKDDIGKMGYTFSDFLNTFKPNQIKGLTSADGKWSDILKDITTKNIKDLSYKQKDLLKKIEVSVWDLIMADSGGHPSITNATNLWALGKGYPEIMKGMMMEITKELHKL